jgi:hypothetical protein
MGGFQWRKYERFNFIGHKRNDPEAELKLDSKNVFHLKTIDNIMYTFDATNGEIKMQYQR